MNNIYYDPEKYGLEIVAEIDYSTGCYEFALRVVWRNKETGKLYTDFDEGCSCPTPFEGVGISDLEELRTVDGPLHDEVMGNVDSRGYSCTHQEAQEFLDKVRRLLKEAKS